MTDHNAEKKTAVCVCHHVVLLVLALIIKRPAINMVKFKFYLSYTKFINYQAIS